MEVHHDVPAPCFWALDGPFQLRTMLTLLTYAVQTLQWTRTNHGRCEQSTYPFLKWNTTHDTPMIHAIHGARACQTWFDNQSHQTWCVGVTQKGEKMWFMFLIGSNLYPPISNSCLYESKCDHGIQLK
jgi:hypothetical protein